MSVTNSLPRTFASTSMSSTDIVEEPNQNPILSNGPTRSNPEDGTNNHYIDPSFCDELKRSSILKCDLPLNGTIV